MQVQSKKSEYFSKAQDIDYIREEFLKLQQSGLDYDCFICVKVSQTGVEQADISKRIGQMMHTMQIPFMIC